MPGNNRKEYFLILGMEEQRITAAVACLSDNEITILGTGENPWNNQENPSEIADIAISTAEKNLEESVLLEKVIFGIGTKYIENDAITSEYLAILKTIAKDLDLKPNGFIEYPQAISYYLESKEGSSPTLLLLTITESHIMISLLRVGRIEKNVTVPRSPSFSEDISHMVSTFKDEILPSRILLYDQAGKMNIEELREELLRFPWHKHSSFLHTPKIETLPKNIGILALVEATGGSILKTMHEEETSATTAQKPAEVQKTEENFGFVTSSEKTDKAETKKTVSSTPIQTLLSRFTTLFSNVSFPPLFLPSVYSHRKIFYILPILVSIFLITVAGFGVLWNYPTSDIHLIVYPLSVSQDVEIQFSVDLTQATNPKNSIKATAVSTSVTGEQTSPTTGKSNIGEKASGEVTIYNKTLSAKTFSKGTLLTSDSLKFTLDQDISIASASDTGEGLTFGKITSKTTASEIGPGGNISPGQSFSFKDFPDSSFYAKNAEKFSGGTSREISSVSKEDQDRLLSSLSDELVKKAKQQILQQLASDERILDESVQSTLKSKKYSKEIGAETTDLTLNLTLGITALSYKNSDITTLSPNIPPEVSSEFVSDPARTILRIKSVKAQKDGDYKAVAAVLSYYIPSIDVSAVKTKLAGKSYKDVSTYLSTVKNIGGFEIIEYQTLPFWENRIPLRPDNVSISILPR